MASTTNIARLSLSLRPLRLAFLLNPQDPAEIAAALRVAAASWGGIYSVMVPFVKDDSLRRAWSDLGRPPPTVEELVAQYLDATEPDYIVSANTDAVRAMGWPVWRTGALEDFCDPQGRLEHGLTARAVYDAVYDAEFKFVRADPFPVVKMQDIADEMSLFRMALVGTLPEGRRFEEYHALYAKLRPTYVELTPEQIFAVSTVAVQTPLSMATFGCRFLGRHPPYPEVFLLDARNPIDVLDFWNLRATGRDVLPVPISMAREMAPIAARFMSEHVSVNPSLPQGDIIKSRFISQPLLEQFSAAVRASHPQPASISLQMWVPRFLGTGEATWPDVERMNVSAGQTEVEVQIEGDRFDLRTLSPRFPRHYGSHGGIAWANVIEWKSSGLERDLVRLPSTLREVGELFGGSSGLMGEPRPRPVMGAWLRQNSEGLVLSCSEWMEEYLLHRPRALDVFRFWLRDSVESVAVSDAGRVAAQALGTLQGPMGAAWIAHPEIIRRLSRAKPLAYAEWLGVLKLASDNDEARARKAFGVLISRGILQVGLQLTCTTCGSQNWYPVARIHDVLTCARCSRDFPFPAISPPKAEHWTYRAQGVFAGRAAGAFTVALTARFFSVICSLEAMWLPGLEVVKDRQKMEVDLAGIVRRGGFHADALGTVPLLVECKSMNDFEAVDFERAKRLLEIVPDAVLAFATLKATLTSDEARSIAEVAALAPTIILTGSELATIGYAMASWTDEAREVYQAGRQRDEAAGLAGLARATQSLYLRAEEPAWSPS